MQQEALPLPDHEVHLHAPSIIEREKTRQEAQQTTSTAVNRLDLDIVRKESSRTGTYIAALVVTASMLPIIAGVISVVVYVTQWSKGLPYWIALLVGSPFLIDSLAVLIIIWPLIGILYRRFTAVNHARTRSYDFLLKRLQQLDVRLQLLDFELEIESGDSPARVAVQSTSGEANETEYEMSPSGNSLMPILGRIEALAYRNAIYDELKSKNISWVLSTGYIHLWGLVQLAGEALIEVSPRATVIRGALYDKACIQHSNMDNRNELLDNLMRAVTMLDAIARGYGKQPTHDQQLLTQEDSSSIPTIGEDSAAEAQARAVLREVRHTLNQFRNSRWEALVHTRNLMICTMVLAGLLLYLLLELIITSIPPSAIIVAMALLVVSTIIGLFGRLYRESQASRSIDDYGLTTARLVLTPMFSGIAAIGGVLVIQQFYRMVNLFDPKHLPVGLFVAAICGIIPNLFMNAFQKQAERYKADLKSAQATEFPERGKGLFSVNEPRSLLSRLAYAELERGVIVREQRMDASQLSLLKIARARLEDGVRWRRTKELEVSLSAITRIDLEEEKTAFVDKTYSLEVGLSLSKSGNFNDGSSGHLPMRSIDDTIAFDLLFHGSENIKLLNETEWHKCLQYKPYNLEPQFVEFTFQVRAPGHHSLIIDFYYERCWLRTTRLEFKANEKTKLITDSSEV